MAGSIEKRGENTYRLVVSTGKNLDGSRARRTKTIHGTRKDAEIALAEFVTEANRGLVPEGKPVTFEEFYHIWQVNYGMIVKKSFVGNSGKNLIGYLYKIIANLCILIQ